MKLLTAAAFALTMATTIGGASACEDLFEQMALQAPIEQQIAAAELKQMAMNYLEEIADEHRIG